MQVYAPQNIAKFICTMSLNPGQPI